MHTNDQPTIAIASNFTVESIREPLEYWLEELGIDFKVVFCPFDQVIQQILDPGSSPATAQFATILLQLERWARSPADPVDQARLQQNADLFVKAIQTAVARGRSTDFLAIFCPPAPSLLQNSSFASIETTLHDGLNRLPGVDVLTSRDLEVLYPNENYAFYFDRNAEHLAQEPYTRLCFTMLGTVVARKLYALKSDTRKVIAVDCGNTLGSGVCGEHGPEGIVVDRHREDLQRFLLKQSEGGRLLCLCSKNDEKDVFSVFNQHPEMPLRLDHFTKWKINWNPKSDNIRVLSAELGLGLNSFVFIDDDPFECSAMEAAIPNVLTLHLPPSGAEYESFLRSVWDLDLKRTTDDDRKRMFYYRQNAERVQALAQTTSMEDFLDTLELRVDISPLAKADIVRAAQLTERVNQFNLNGIRRSEAELRGLLNGETAECLIVRASDRFGEYGTVGVMIVHRNHKRLKIASLALSCRALGKGIEQHILNKLVTRAQSGGARTLDFDYRPTTRNTSFGMFLRSLGALKTNGRCSLDRDFLIERSSVSSSRFVLDPNLRYTD